MTGINDFLQYDKKPADWQRDIKGKASGLLLIYKGGQLKNNIEERRSKARPPKDNFRSTFSQQLISQLHRHWKLENRVKFCMGGGG
jgi:hypothetical protein